jgi:hypothetical protein
MIVYGQWAMAKDEEWARVLHVAVIVCQTCKDKEERLEN